MKTNLKTLLLLSTLPLVIISCNKDDEDEPQPTPTALEIKTVSNLFANDPNGHYTFFSLRTNAVINLTDSATSNWDLAFYSTKILINGGTSGPGNGGGVVIEQSFDDVTTAPHDSVIKTDNGTSFAIPTGSGNGWYNYDGVNMVINPIAGRTIVVRTADGKFGKIEILSYYKNAPATPTMADTSRYYKFRFTYQSDGTKKIK